MASSPNNYQTVDTDQSNDDDQLLHQFLYDDKSIEELADERDEHWAETYHVLLEELEEIEQG